jgi:hypothetical protein
MIYSIPEYLRKLSVNSCFSLSAFVNSWKTWKNEINAIIGDDFESKDILNLGDSLSEIFLSTRNKGRSQSSVSGAGNGWEGLICWYLNLCMIGSRAVAIRKTNGLPKNIRNAISVNYGNFKSNTEADITVIVFPDKEEFKKDIKEISNSEISTKKKSIKNLNKLNALDIINHLTDIHFDNFEIGIIQCKTNWNENAQIPMLWSMVYEANFTGTSISIGTENYSIRDVSKFTYSFCTVPTNKLENYSQFSTSVNRVRNLTGGNYWGFPSKSGISSSIKEIFNHNFRNAFYPNQRTLMNNNIKNLSNDFSYFNLI